MTQSEKIRDIVFKLLSPDHEKNNNPFTGPVKREIIVNNRTFEAIKYKDLKKFLLEKEFDFSEGAITGALQTLPDRLANIFKEKTKEGVFFFYSDNKNISLLNQNHENTIIPDSVDYKALEDKVEEVNQAVIYILKKASNGNYSNVNEDDIKNLREILKNSGELSTSLSRYKTEKTFEKIQQKTSMDDLPF